MILFILLKYQFLSVFFGFPVFHQMQHRLNQFSKNNVSFRFPKNHLTLYHTLYSYVYISILKLDGAMVTVVIAYSNDCTFNSQKEALNVAFFATDTDQI